MTDQEAIQREVDQNYEAFQALLPTLLPAQAGKYALMRHAEIVEYFDTIDDALKYATKVFDDEIYSIQQVTETVEDLGFFSHAVHHAAD